MQIKTKSATETNKILKARSEDQFLYLHKDAIGRPDKPQCSSFNVFRDDVSIDFPRLIALDSDNGVPRVTSICNAWLRFTILMHACQPRFVIFRFSDISISLAAS